MVAKLFSEEVDPDVIWSQLRKVINNIIYERNVNSDYVLFALRRYLRLGKPLHYPQGLYYVIRDKDALKEWTELQNNKIKSEVKVDIENLPEVKQLNYKVPKPKGFKDILKAGGTSG